MPFTPLGTNVADGNDDNQNSYPEYDRHKHCAAPVALVEQPSLCKRQGSKAKDDQEENDIHKNLLDDPCIAKGTFGAATAMRHDLIFCDLPPRLGNQPPHN